jgi:hypothetical protein
VLEYRGIMVKFPAKVNLVIDETFLIIQQASPMEVVRVFSF